MDPEGLIADIDCEITLLQNSLSLYPRSHPEHIHCVISLSHSRWERYTLSQDKGDLDKWVVHCTEAILLPRVSRDGPHFESVIHSFFHLAHALLERSEFLDHSEDIKYSIAYLRYLRGLHLDSFDLPRDLITTSLIRALCTQVGTRNIKEMVALCRELLTSNLSAGFPNEIFRMLNFAINDEVRRGNVEPLDTVIEFLRDAAKMRPSDSHTASFALVRALGCTRFIESHSNDDYEEAMALLDRIMDPSQPGGCPDSIRDKAPELAAQLALTRSTIFKNPEYSEVIISRLRALFSSSSVDKGLRLQLADLLALEASDRFKQYSLPESLEEAESYTLQVVDLSSSESLEEPVWGSESVLESCSITEMTENIQRLEELLLITPLGTKRHCEYLTHLADWCIERSNCTDDVSDLEESIKYKRLQLEAAHPNDQGILLLYLQSLLFHAFEKTAKISYLDDSITTGYDILEFKSARRMHFRAVRELVRSLLTRERLLDNWSRDDRRHEAIRLISTVIDDPYTQEPDRFLLSCDWAVFARSIGHHTTLAAYKTAMSLMQKSLSFAPTVSVQHTQLVALGWYCKAMPLDYASFHLDFFRFEEAIETLEQGRALLWSEMRVLRAPVAQLSNEDSHLTKRFGEINRELEALTISITPSGRPEMVDGSAQGGDWTDPFGRLVITQRKLVEERDALVSQIQRQQGFEGFSRAPSFSTLRSAASHELRDELVEARKHGLDSDEYHDALCSVLKGLYELVGEPVIKRLRMLGVPEQSRIWWCPTSVFCSLPLHAMGPIPSSDPSKRYFSDFYIPSYTPSLSALIESRRASPQILEKPSLLLVAQPEDSLSSAKGEVKVIQRALDARVTVTSLVSSEATPRSVVEGLRGSQLAHFACHGLLETGKPFDACFRLHGGSRLTLLDIVQSRLPDAEFAFLSCCHTAEITEDSIADEALHLTAAMQYCGFRSVVGTMWAMADTDGRDLAKSFYKSLFSGQDSAVPYYERSAEALRDATQRLRMKRGISLERWVNYVHYGA